METNTILEQFKDECQVIEFKYEYPGYVGYEQYGIITALSESELTEKYGDIIKEYVPYLLLDSTYKEARDEFRKNERKHAWRATNTLDAFNYEDGEMERFHPELVAGSVEDDFIKQIDDSPINSALKRLSPKQRKRIIAHYYEGLSITDIANMEKNSPAAIHYSIEGGIKKLKKFLKTT